MGRLKHTPGPWKPVARLVDPAEDCIAWSIEGPLGQMGEVRFGLEADARLAAAAPGMYEALLDMEKYTEDPAQEPKHDVLAVMLIGRIVKEALERVEGEMASRDIEVPLCPRCRSSERITHLGTVSMDLGGYVAFWLCRRCGVPIIFRRSE